jgi:glycogen debranching enzyme
MTSADEVAITSGRSFLLSDCLGDIVPSTRQGLFFADTRFLSCYCLTLSGQRMVRLGGSQLGADRAKFYATNPDLPGIPAGTLTIERERVLNGRLTDSIAITNYGQTPATLLLRLELASDFADVLELRDVPPTKLTGSEIHPPLGWHHAFAYRRENFACRTLLRWSRRGRHSDNDATFQLRLAPHQTWHCRAEIEMTRETGPRVGSHEDLHPEGLLSVGSYHPADRTHDADTGKVHREQLRPALALVRDQALADLRTLTFELSTGEQIVGAGLPYFMTLFGRDSILTAAQLLPGNTQLAANVLRALARYQATVDDPLADQEPGKIPHEVREGELALRGEQQHGRYYGSVDATPLFLVLLSEYLKRTNDTELREALWPAAEAALGWIDGFGDIDGDGFVEYLRRAPNGLANQGWKDSWDAVSFADGCLAEGPIALCEVQGYVYNANLCMADLYERRGDVEQSGRLRAQARVLRERFERAFWLPQEGTYALALDGSKRPVDAIASNAAHVLWSGIASAEHAASVVARLSEPDCFSGWGLRTLSTRMARYNPISYHNGSVWPHDTAIAALGYLRYGHRTAARRLLLALVEAATRFPDHRVPELFSGHARGAGESPVSYPDSNIPQAWAAGAVVLAARLLSRDLATQERTRSGDRVTQQHPSPTPARRSRSGRGSWRRRRANGLAYYSESPDAATA